MSEEYDYLFKSIVVGDGGVGKTALTLRFSKDFFTEDYKMTIGVDFHVKTITINTLEGPIKAKLQLWDTGGQERFSSIRPMYYRGSLGAVLVFDLTNAASFEHLPQWIEEVRANLKTEIPLLLVGNKSDLIDHRMVSLEEINNFTRDFNLYYMETSAKTGDGVGDCFYILACLMIGQGIPTQLLNNIVYNPGQIPVSIIEEKISSIQLETMTDYAAPPVPEPVKTKSIPEIKYAAPPVPEPITETKEKPIPSFAPTSIPEISVPDPAEFEFKTPEEILSQEAINPQTTMQSSKISQAPVEESYKPRTVPFSSNIPVPAPTPEEFKTHKVENSPVTSNTQTIPFIVSKKEEPIKPKPASMTFEPAPSSTSDSPISQSLVDYMPETIISKKEKKKLEKEKKKKEKEIKIKVEKEKQDRLIDEMKQSKKEKNKGGPVQELVFPKSDATISTPSLFQALTQKTEEVKSEKSTPFLSFASIEEPKTEESSTLRIIPNVADIEPESNSFTVITSRSESSIDKEPKPKDFLTCSQCGAILSSDYAFCNKCGNKLT
ncbi:MAG TPA: GTP-binding protein [candidate division Zixibacteria bacterium]|nr:GTP-binding protein [candidate division Zixibacteria bacterium]